MCNKIILRPYLTPFFVFKINFYVTQSCPWLLAFCGYVQSYLVKGLDLKHRRQFADFQIFGQYLEIKIFLVRSCGCSK